MNWTLARAIVYLATLAASGLAIYGLATFDAATGDFDLAPFNLYTAIGAGSGLVSSTLATVAVWRKWGK
jgi:hypothetical protein